MINMRYVVYRKKDNLYYTGKMWPENSKPIFNRNILSAKVYDDAEEAHKDIIELAQDGLIITEYYR